MVFKPGKLIKLVFRANVELQNLLDCPFSCPATDTQSIYSNFTIINFNQQFNSDLKGKRSESEVHMKLELRGNVK